jgi:hypothetical protein
MKQTMEDLAKREREGMLFVAAVLIVVIGSALL